MNKNKRELIKKRLELLYGNKADEIVEKIDDLVDFWRDKNIDEKPWVNEKDVVVITYGDSLKKEGEYPLSTLKRFLDKYCEDSINGVHILPMFPFTSDDGFSVVDYKKINEELGTWDEINDLKKNYDLMFDAVINHISKSSDWFKKWLNREEDYLDYFHDCDPKLDYSMVTRPRALPLLTEFPTADGNKFTWTTFSEDQIDLNFESPSVLLEILDVLSFYAFHGARYIRFDAIGFAWKKLGTTCMHLEETHELVKLMSDVLDLTAPGTIIITETNVPHLENISYFGNGHDEAGMVYQFPLPPLTLFSFLTGTSGKLTSWAKSLDQTPTTNDTTYFNFLASHDGIGMRPTEGILNDIEKQLMVDHVLENGGRIGYKNNPDGTKSPYELNINYMDALSNKEDSDELRVKRMLAAHSILLSLEGIPAIYIHSLVGSRNWEEGVVESGINRRINREKLDYDRLETELGEEGLRHNVLSELNRLIRIRKNEAAFDPNASQVVLDLDERLFSVIRKNEQTLDEVQFIVNVSGEALETELAFNGVNLLNDEPVFDNVFVAPYEMLWVKKVT